MEEGEEMEIGIEIRIADRDRYGDTYSRWYKKIKEDGIPDYLKKG